MHLSYIAIITRTKWQLTSRFHPALTSGGVQELNLVRESVTVKVPAGVVSSDISRPCSKIPRKNIPSTVLVISTAIKSHVENT